MLLREHRSKEQGLSDLLNYAHIVNPGTIYLKDGALMRSVRYLAPDLGSAGDAEADGVNEVFNRMVLNLSDGWMLHIDDIRVPASAYPDMAEFPCTVAQMIDYERRMQYESIGEHYENMQILTFVWKFPKESVKISKSFFIENLDESEKYVSLNDLVSEFEQTVSRCTNTLSAYFNIEPLDSADMLTFLNMCISGKFKAMPVPPADMFLDVLLASEPFTGGMAPMVGNKHIKVLSILGTELEQTYMGILEALSSYPLVYRVSNRFIPFSRHTGEKELKRYRKQWNNKITGFLGLIGEALLNKPSKNQDEHAEVMKDEVKNAIAWNNSGRVVFGFWTCEIVFMHEDMSVLNYAINDFQGALDKIGFNSYEEDTNAVDAFLGTIPGHGSCNVRRVFLNSKQLGQVLPLSSVWAGDDRVSRSSFLPKDAPVCFMADTSGSTPFRHNVDHEDIGHTATIGPTGAGKTTFQQFMMTQFYRYPQAHGFIFDKDLSQYGWTYAMGGKHYNIGEDSKLGFAPFKRLETETERKQANQFLTLLCELQNIEITTKIRQHISQAINSLATTAIDEDRSISRLEMLAHEDIKEAIHFYTLKGSFSMLDSMTDSIEDGYLHCFEMGWLIKQDKQYYLPILMHIFNRISNFLNEADKAKPTFVFLEEAWQYLDHEVFRKFIIDWAKTFRKFNARLWVATQSLNDLYDSATRTLKPSTAAILEACSTRIYLPNDKMDKSTEELYYQIGLTERQVEIIKTATPKRDYYLVRPPLEGAKNQFSGKRLFNLGWTDLDKKPLALSFIGLNLSKSKRLAELIRTNPAEKDWLPLWLEEEGQQQWLEYYYQNFNKDAQ